MSTDRLAALLPCEDPEEPCDADGRDEHRWCDNCIARAAVVRAGLRVGDPPPPADFLAGKDRSMAEYSDTRSACPECGEWRDAPDADCAACGYAVGDPPPPADGLRAALLYAVNQWRMYADKDRGPGYDFAYIDESEDGGDAEAEQFRRCRAALAEEDRHD